jgi:hypothetical protein
MSKFVVVKEAPKDLKKGEYLIDKPSFIEQIALHSAKKPRNGLTGSHYLRMITDSIAQAYDPENMSAYSIKAHLYEGRKFSSDSEMNDIIVEALKNNYPAIFSKYLEKKIRNRPAKTELVIYVDSQISGQYELFYQNGLSEAKAETPKEDKPKRTVGKPAITNEEAEAQKNQADTE